MGIARGLVFVLLLAVAAHAGSNKQGSGGYDAWGYNYNSFTFSGWACRASRDSSAPCAYSGPGPKLYMNWDDRLLSTNGALQANSGSFIGTGAWFTNHIRLSLLDNGASGSAQIKVQAKNSAGQACAIEPFGTDFCVVKKSFTGDGAAWYHGPIMPSPAN